VECESSPRRRGSAGGKGGVIRQRRRRQRMFAREVTFVVRVVFFKSKGVICV